MATDCGVSSTTVPKIRPPSVVKTVSCCGAAASITAARMASMGGLLTFRGLG
jgi:hypothetical protein